VIDGIPDTFCIHKKPNISGVEANLTNCSWCFIGLVYIANLRYPAKKYKFFPLIPKD
jgi:hypothetical protein